MANAGRSNLPVNGRGTDVTWFGTNPAQQRNIYKIQGWDRSINYILETFNFTTQDTPRYGKGHKVTFEIDKKGDLAGPMTLIVTRGALTGGTTGQLAFNDWEGYSSIDTITFWYNNKIFYTLRGDHMYIDMMKQETPESRKALAALQFGNRSLPERIANATSTYTWMLPLPVPWRNIKRRLRMIAFGNKIRIEVTFKDLNTITTCAAAPSCTINDVKLRVEYVHLPMHLRVECFNEVNTGNGVAFKTITKEFHPEVSVASGTTKFTYRLRNLKNAAVTIYVADRKRKNVESSGYPNEIDRWNFQLPKNFYITDGSNRVTDIIHGNDADNCYENIYRDGPRMHPNGEVGFKVMEIAFCEKSLVEPSETHCFGSRNLSKYNNPEIVVEWPSALGEEHYLDIIANIHNLIIQKKGEIRCYLA